MVVSFCIGAKIMRIEEEVKLDFKDVLIRPKRSKLSSRSQVSLERTYKLPNSGNTMTIVPTIVANLDTAGTMKMSNALSAHKMMTAIHKHYAEDKLVEFFSIPQPYAFYSIGTVKADLDKLERVYEKVGANIQNICIDVANGYTQSFINFIRKFREKYPSFNIMAGNVVSGEMTEELIISGVDIVKVGIGGGSFCTTRKMTGVGYPQLSAIIECADAAHGLKGLICGDGGCTVPGDVVKAFAGGADFVMMGGMFSGYDECEAEVITDEATGKKFLKTYGMSSQDAMAKHAGGVAEYRASEGKTVLVPHKGPVSQAVQDIQGGLRSACTYVGANTIKELPRRTTFIRVTQQLNEVWGKSV